MISLLLQELIFLFLPAFTAAGVVQCGGRKSLPVHQLIGLDLYSRQVFNYLDPILIYISLWIDCLFEIRKITLCFLWLSLPGNYSVTDEAL